MSTLDRPIEDDDISHDSEAYRRWKGTDSKAPKSKQEEVLGKGPHPTAGLDTAIPLAFMSFFATAWCSFLIVFNIMGQQMGEGGPPFLFIQIFMVPFYGVGLFLLYMVYGGIYNLFVDKDTGIIAKILALLIGLWPPLAFYLIVNSILKMI
jgi:hypothetical protein